MANTTFSGPIRAGNIRNTTGTTIGTDIANVGYVVMCQDTVQSLAGGALAAAVTDIVIPANSKIVNCIYTHLMPLNCSWNLYINKSSYYTAKNDDHHTPKAYRYNTAEFKGCVVQD